MTIRANDLVNARVTTAYGTSRHAQKLYRGLLADTTLFNFSVEDRYTVYVREQGGRRIGEISNRSGDPIMVELEFELDENGCSSGRMSLSELPNFPLELGQSVEIMLRGDTKPWYSGVINEIPAIGSITENHDFKLFGLYQLLDKVVLKESDTVRTKFGYTDVTTAAYEIARDFVGPTLGVGINTDKIQPANFVSSELDFELVTAKKALSDLAALANNFIYGIDASGDFFFRPRRLKALSKTTVFPSHTISDLEISRNSDDLVNRLYLKDGRLDQESGNYSALLEDEDSQRVYGIRDKIVSVPTVVSTPDVERWGLWYLNTHRDPQEIVKASMTQVNTFPLTPGDMVRVNVKTNTINYSDAFDSDDVSVYWTKVNTLGSNFTQLNTTGHLGVYPGLGTSESPISMPLIYRRIPGDFLLDTFFGGNPSGVSNAFISSTAVGIHLRESSTRWIELVRRRTSHTAAQGGPKWWVERRDVIDGVMNIQTTTQTTGLDPMYLRVRRIDGGFQTHWGTDLNSMNLIEASVSQPFSSALPLLTGLTAYTEGNSLNTAGSTIVYNFSYFTVENQSHYYDAPLRTVKYSIDNEGIVGSAFNLGDFRKPFQLQLTELSEGVRVESIRQDRNIKSIGQQFSRKR